MTKGFVIYPTYRIKGDKSYILLFGKLENGKPFATINHFRPYFFIKKVDVEKAKKIATFDFEEIDLIDFKKEPVVKILVNIPKEVPAMRRIFEDMSIVCYEADVRFAYRFLIDYGIKGDIEISGQPESIKEDFEFANFFNKDFLAKNPEIYINQECKGTESNTSLKLLSFDIETSSTTKKLFAVSLYSRDLRVFTSIEEAEKAKNQKLEEIKEVFIVNENSVPNAQNFTDEAKLLKHLKKRINEIDPDILTGWNVIDFDLIVLNKFFKKYGIPFDIGRGKGEAKVDQEVNFVMESKADVVGRIVLDGIHLIKTSFLKFTDYKLNTVAHEVLGVGKTVEFKSKGDEIEAMFKDDPKTLAEYNLKDSILVFEIIEKLGLIELTVQRTRVHGMQLDRVKASVASLDALYLGGARKRKYVCYSVSKYNKDESAKGALVLDPKGGLYEYVIVCDFKSLYPSIIRTFNIDPLSFDPKGEIEAPNGARFINQNGILPDIIEKIWKKRDLAKKQNNKVASHALKITMNSFYGALGNSACRYYSMDITNAITSFGRFLIKLTVDELEKMGYEIIYGDTDSVFVNVKAKNIDEADKAGKKIEKFVNDFYDIEIKKRYNRENVIEIEYEKLYKVFLLPMGQDEKAVKKRYVGLRIERTPDGIKEKMEFTGLEFVRKDWTELSKQFQFALLDRVFHKKPYEEYIRTFVNDLQNGKFDNLLVYRKSLSKNLNEYTKTTPPHVKAARMLDKLNSSIISYVITTNGPEPIEMQKSKIDYQHYIEKQIKPIADRILVIFQKDFNEILNQQKNLFDFSSRK